MNTISAPILDNFISKAQSYPDLLSQEEKNILLRIIEKLQCIAICGNDDCRELWLTIECGSIEDFGRKRVDAERLTKEDIDALKIITELSENENQLISLDKMTSGFFFDCWKMGYDANNYSYDTGQNR